MADASVQWQVGSLEFKFRTTHELKDRLLDSFAHSAYAGGPFIMVGPDPVPAWSWLASLARLRSDWRASAGIALQHASAEGGGMAQTALTDLVANDRAAGVLLPWTEPLVARFGTARATQATTGFGGGRSDPTFADVIRDQRAFWDLVTQSDREVILDAGKGKPRIVALTNAQELEDLLTQTATRGTFYLTGWSDSPWSWLHEEVLYRGWVPEVVPDIMARMLARGEAEVLTTLDWLSDGWDRWRFLPLLEALLQMKPPWWGVSAKLKPAGWKRPIRPATWSGVTTLGEIALRHLTAAREAAATHPVRDLSAIA